MSEIELLNLDSDASSNAVPVQGESALQEVMNRLLKLLGPGKTSKLLKLLELEDANPPALSSPAPALAPALATAPTTHTAPAPALAIAPTPARRFHTNGPINREDARRCYVIPHSDEALGVLLDAAAGTQVFIFHGPRQSGKTTRSNALRERLSHLSILTLTLELFASSTVQDLLQAITMQPTHDLMIIDEFDLLALRPDHEIAAVLRHLRGQNQQNRKPVILLGPAKAAFINISSSEGSPFNGSCRAVASPFTRVQVERLFDEFAREHKLQVEPAVLDSIFTLTQGHRGLVTCAGGMVYNFVVHVWKGALEQRSVTLKDWLDMSDEYHSAVLSTAAFIRHRDTLKKLPDITNSDVYRLLYQARSTPLLYTDISSDEQTLKLVVNVLADIGLLRCNDTCTVFYSGPPIFDALAPRLFSYPAVQLPPSHRQLLQLLLQKSLPVVKHFFAHSACKVREKGNITVPKEDAYLDAFKREWQAIVNAASFPLDTPVPQASVTATKGRSPSLDLLVKFPDTQHLSALEFVAHERVGPAERSGSVEEHIVRTKGKYGPLATEGELWVINCELLDVKEEHVKAAGVAGVNVLHFFHNAEFDVVEFV